MKHPIRALLIHHDGVTDRVISQDLKTLQSLVGGYVETIRLGHDCIGLVDEDGKAKSLILNRRATLLCDILEIGWHDEDVIRGPMIVVGMADQEGYFTTVPDRIVAMFGKVNELMEGPDASQES